MEQSQLDILAGYGAFLDVLAELEGDTATDKNEAQ